jgi:Ca-activated chloride channel family protein
MIKFEHSLYLWLLLVVPVILALYAYVSHAKRRQIAEIGNPELMEKLMPARNERRSWFKIILASAGLALLILALASPQMGTKMEKVQRKGIDVVIALDLSKSMLSQDVAPNRLEKSKLLIREVVTRLDGDRVGLVVFAGRAYLQMPLTVDYSSILLYLKSLNTNSIPTPGTAVGEALAQAEKAFKTGETKHKTIILISDGEDHQQDAIDFAKEAGGEGTVIHTVGVGTLGGGTIPVFDERGNKIGEKQDADGNIVVTKLNENMLQDLAKAGKGQYYYLDNTKQVAAFLAKDVAQIETKTINDKIYTDYVNQYQYFLALGLLCIVADIFIAYRKKRP